MTDVGDSLPHPRVRSAPPFGLAAVVALPLVVAVIVLAFRPWAPTLDMAMTELRVRDVGGRHTPLIGLPGRIGTFPDSQGSHPGPWSFYLLAPWYRLAGASAWGLELGSVVVNAAALAGTVLVGARLGGRRLALVLAAVGAVAVRGYGLGVLTHPWNPYFPVLLWLLTLTAAWAALAGHPRAALIVVAAGSVAAQTHVPYLLNAIALCALVLAHLAYGAVRGEAARRGEIVRAGAWSAGVGGLLWLPPFVDQLRHDPGNIRMLVTHFASDPPEEEPLIGAGEAVRVFFRHLDAMAMAADLVTRRAAFVHRSGLPSGSWAGGAVVFALWSGAVVVAWRRRHRLLLALHSVLAVALAVEAFSIGRIFGKVWYYLTLWAWGTTLLVVVSIVWTAVLLLRERAAWLDAAWQPAAAAVLLFATVASAGAAFGLEVPEPQLSDGLRAVLPATVTALDDGTGDATGRDGRYAVFWQDAAYNGSQGYGLVNELERRGFHVGVGYSWRTPTTPHRVMAEGTYDAEVHLVSGEFIDEWRARAGYVEVVEYDRRTDAERERFAELRWRVTRRLAELGRSDLDEQVDRNLFGASLDPDLPRDVVDDLSEMLLLSVPIAVFIAPAGSFEAASGGIP